MDQRGKMTRTDKSHLPANLHVNGFQGNNFADWKPPHRTRRGRGGPGQGEESMAKNTMMYNALTGTLYKNFSGLSSVIQKEASKWTS